MSAILVRGVVPRLERCAVALRTEAAVPERPPVGLATGVGALVERVAFLEPLGESEHLIRRPRLEAARAAFGVVGVVVDAGVVAALRLHLRVLAVVLVLGHHEHPAGAHLHAGNDSAHVALGPHLGNIPVQRGDRGLLHVQVERRVHLVAAPAEAGQAGLGIRTEHGVVQEFLGHVVAEVCVRAGGLASGARLGDPRLDLGREGRVVFLFRDLLVLEHRAEDVVAAFPVDLVAVGLAVRGAQGPVELELDGVVHDRDEAGRLREREPGGRRAEVVVGGGLDAVDRAAEAGDVEVLAEDVVFRVLLLHPDREAHFPELAIKSRLRGGEIARVMLLLDREHFALLHEHVLDVLLRDRRPTLGHPGRGRLEGRTERALEVDAAMLVETRVLAGDRGILRVLADFVPCHLDPVLVVERRQQHGFSITLGGVDAALLRELVDGQVVGQVLENVDRVPDRHAGNGDRGRDGHRDQDPGGGAHADEADEATEHPGECPPGGHGNVRNAFVHGRYPPGDSGNRDPG